MCIQMQQKSELESYCFHCKTYNPNRYCVKLRIRLRLSKMRIQMQQKSELESYCFHCKTIAPNDYAPDYAKLARLDYK